MATSNPEIPVVRDGVLYDHEGNKLCDLDAKASGHTAWRQWARNPKNTSFAYKPIQAPEFHVTVCKEARASNSGQGRTLYYFYVFKKISGKHHKTYPGSDRSISLETLERAVRKMRTSTLEDAAETKEDRQAWQTARRKSLRRRRPGPRREMPEEPQTPAGQQLGLW